MFKCFVVVFKCLNATITLTCTLANECPFSNEISKKNSTVQGDCMACDASFVCIETHAKEAVLIWKIHFPIY